MNTRNIFICVILLSLYQWVDAQNPQDDPNWEIVLEENFDIFNTGRWWKETGFREEGNSTEDIACLKAENAFTLAGKLILMVKRDTVYHDGPCFYNGHAPGNHFYSAASVVSSATYGHGYFEILAKMPVTTGYWSSFWLWDSKNTTSEHWYNEIDIFETKGCYPDSNFTNVHWGFTYPIDIQNGVSISYACNPPISSYHWYGLEWDSRQIVWYLDRQPVRICENNMENIGIQHPMHIILSNALTPTLDSNNIFQENLIDPNVTTFPGYMYIDKANVYRLKCDNQTVVVDIPNFSTYQYGVKKKYHAHQCHHHPHRSRYLFES